MRVDNVLLDSSRRTLTIMSDNSAAGDPQADKELRKAARQRLKARQGFWGMVAVWVFVGAITTVVWALSGGGYFWPAWAMFGIGIGVVVSGWSAFGPGNKPITDSDVEAEMRKMQGGQ